MATYRPEGLEDTFATSAAAPGADGSSDAPAAPPRLPRLGPTGWARWAWRQLTSMRVALLLLMLLAVAAVPGTIFPQRAQDVSEVAQYIDDHPSTGPWLDRFGFFGYPQFEWSRLRLESFRRAVKLNPSMEDVRAQVEYLERQLEGK